MSNQPRRRLWLAPVPLLLLGAYNVWSSVVWPDGEMIFQYSTWAKVHFAFAFIICLYCLWVDWQYHEWSVWREGGRGNKKRKWVFMERFVIPDPRDPSKNHFTRYRIFQCPWFGIYVHHFECADRPFFHDHPWHFISIILKGWYTERIAGRHASGATIGGYSRRLGRFSINIKKAKSYHFVERVAPGGAWSFLIVSRRKQDWGFGDANGWTLHSEHPLALAADEAMKLRRAMKEMK